MARSARTGTADTTGLPGTEYVVPPARELKRERKALLEVREERLRDLGGLALEMYKRDRFSADLVVERCAELRVAFAVQLAALAGDELAAAHPMPGVHRPERRQGAGEQE